jgi:hypothetical protein
LMPVFTSTHVSDPNSIAVSRPRIDIARCDHHKATIGLSPHVVRGGGPVRR